jgi:hypothetical protein
VAALPLRGNRSSAAHPQQRRLDESAVLPSGGPGPRRSAASLGVAVAGARRNGHCVRSRLADGCRFRVADLSRHRQRLGAPLLLPDSKVSRSCARWPCDATLMRPARPRRGQENSKERRDRAARAGRVSSPWPSREWSRRVAQIAGLAKPSKRGDDDRMPSEGPAPRKSRPTESPRRQQLIGGALALLGLALVGVGVAAVSPRTATPGRRRFLVCWGIARGLRRARGPLGVAALW